MCQHNTAHDTVIVRLLLLVSSFTKNMMDQNLLLILLLISPLVYGQEPTNRPSNGK